MIKSSFDKPTFGPGRCEYRTVDVRTLKGLICAERMVAAGWRVASHGLDTVQLYREKKRRKKNVRR